jgi:hypothetical protein
MAVSFTAAASGTFSNEWRLVMPYIAHPARQGDTASIFDWLRFHIGTWMQRKGADLEYRALYPNDTHCTECGQWVHPGQQCDHIPF